MAVIFTGKVSAVSSPPRKTTEKNNLMNKILPYSARKNKAKLPELNSVLKPETSSDSPSEKSKGVRLVSASEVTNHTTPKGRERKIIHWNLEYKRNWFKE